MAKSKSRCRRGPGRPPGMTLADELAHKRMIRQAVQDAADDATVQVRADTATQKALWLAVCSIADAYGFGPERMQRFFEALQEETTDRQYEILLMHEVEGLSGKEIAVRLGISQSAVSRHLTRGKKRLRRLLAYNLELRNRAFPETVADTDAAV